MIAWLFGIIDSFGLSWIDWMKSSAWQIALLIMAITLLVWIFRLGSPHLRYGLWLLVLVKAFLPPQLSLPTGIGTWGFANLRSIHPVLDAILASAETNAFEKTDQLSDLGWTDDESLTTIPGTTGDWIDWIFVVWIGGTIGYWALIAIRYGMLRQRIRSEAELDEGRARIALERSALALKLAKTPDLRATRTLTGPFLFGVFQPCVVLPERFVDEATEEELNAVLAHELTHLQRCDLWIGWVQVVVQGIFWFHPLVWWANRQLRLAREEACDESVLRRTNVTPKGYGEAMLRVISSARARSMVDACSLGIFERGSNLQFRLEKIMSFKKREASNGWFTKLCLGVAAVVLLPMYPGNSGDAVAQDRQAKKSQTPQIVKPVPVIGATEVATTLKEIRVTFDRDMSTGMSWTGGEPLFPPTDASQKAKWIDKRTCVLPVKLEKGMFYRLGINSKSFQKFQSKEGIPADPIAIYFATEGASKEVAARAKIPEIVRLVPPSGSTDVDAKLTEISVTFNMKMGKGMSWTGGGPTFPESPPDTAARWSEDGRTCTLPVKLQPGHSYQLGINSQRHNNFQSEAGIPLIPVVYEFKTR